MLSFGSHYAKKKYECAGEIQRNPPRTGKLSNEERLRDLSWFSCSHEKRRLRGDHITMFQYLKDGYREGDSLYTRQEVMGTNYS